MKKYTDNGGVDGGNFERLRARSIKVCCKKITILKRTQYEQR